MDNDTITVALEELEVIERSNSPSSRPLFTHREALRIVHMRGAIRAGVYNELIHIRFGGQVVWQATAQ